MKEKAGLEEEGGPRSKRTCVRVREEISKLQEILKDPSETKPPAVGKPRGRGRGRSLSADGVALQEAGLPLKKYRRPAYRSQFTHKRRKRRRKTFEEGTIVCVCVCMCMCVCVQFATK